jgi:sorbose reductase
MTEATRVTLQRSTDAYLTSNVFDLFSLKDRVIVITGGARGIGLALAFAIAEAGGQVAILDASNEPHEHYQKLKSVASRVEFYKSDVTDFPVLEETFNQIVTDFGRIDGM